MPRHPSASGAYCFHVLPLSVVKASAVKAKPLWSHLDPNGDGAVPWRQFTSAGQEYLRLGNEFVASAGYKTQACDLLFPGLE